jgi:hypothetical protein
MNEPPTVLAGFKRRFESVSQVEYERTTNGVGGIQTPL